VKAFVEQKVVYDKYFPRGFVTMQYFGYLHRDPSGCRRLERLARCAGERQAECRNCGGRLSSSDLRVHLLD